jgi:hypothetical protein
VNQTQQIADSYRAATLKGAWYGPSLAEMLPEISLLRRHPFRGLIPFRRCFSTCSFGTKEIQNTSDSHPMPRWQPEKEWAEPPIPWNELVTRWNQSRDLLEEKIRNFPIEDLARQVPGRSYP